MAGRYWSQRRLFATATSSSASCAGTDGSSGAVAHKLSASSNQRQSAVQGGPDHHAPPPHFYRQLAQLPATNQRGRPQRRAYSSRNVVATAPPVADLPVRVGASAGLNLGFDHFALTVSGHRFGPEQPVLHLTPVWHGPVPTGIWPYITERRGVDLNPLDPCIPEDATRLTAYLWPDQPKRIAHTHAAIAHHCAVVDTGDAIDWLAHRLEHPRVGQLHLIYHTIDWQYFPSSQQARGRALPHTPKRKQSSTRS